MAGGICQPITVRVQLNFLPVILKPRANIRISQKLIFVRKHFLMALYTGRVIFGWAYIFGMV